MIVKTVTFTIKAFVKAGGEAGYPILDDPNGPTQEGFGIYPTFSYQGVRQRKVILASTEPNFNSRICDSYRL